MNLMVRLREAAGFALLITGLLGLVLPIIPGVPLLAAGVATLGSDHPMVQRLDRWRNSFRRRSSSSGGGEVVWPDQHE